MNIYLLFFILSVSMVAYIWVGQKASSNIQTSNEYYLMDKRLSFFPLAMTLLATQLGGGALVGACDKAYYQGWIVLLYPLGACLGLVFLGIGIGSRLRQLNIKTTAEIFEKIYKSKIQRSVASILSIVSLMLILIAQGLALKKIFISLGLVHPAYYMVFWLILVIYTVMGGLKAVVNTDIIQVLFIMAVLFIAFFISIKKGGLNNVVGSIFYPKSTTSVGLFDSKSAIQWLLMPFLFMFIEQDMGQRCFSAKSDKIISLSTISAGALLMLCSCIGIYFGILARNHSLALVSGSSILIEAVKTYTNPIVTTFFMSAIFMAIVSTADSIIFAISSNIFCDFLGKITIKKEKHRITISKIITFGVGVSALFASFAFNNVINILMLSYSISVCSLSVPILAAMFLNRPSKLGAYMSIIFGGSSFILLNILQITTYNEVISIVVSAVCYIISALWKKRCN